MSVLPENIAGLSLTGRVNAIFSSNSENMKFQWNVHIKQRVLVKATLHCSQKVLQHFNLENFHHQDTANMKQARVQMQVKLSCCCFHLGH